MLHSFALILDKWKAESLADRGLGPDVFGSRAERCTVYVRILYSRESLAWNTFLRYCTSGFCIVGSLICCAVSHQTRHCSSLVKEDVLLCI